MPDKNIVEHANLIASSEYFDEVYYLATYPHASQSELNAAEHYLLEGAAAGLMPSAGFDTQFYLANYPDVAKSGMNPLLHFIKYGIAEGRKPLAQKAVVQDLTEQALEAQKAERQEPSAEQHQFNAVAALPQPTINELYNILSASDLFDPTFYVAKYPDIKRAGVDPLQHYIEFGASEGRLASEQFNTAFYLASYPHIKKLGINPLYHYLQLGAMAGYLATATEQQDSDITANVPEDMAVYLLQQFLFSGQIEQFKQFFNQLIKQNINGLLAKNDYSSVLAEYYLQTGQESLLPQWFTDYKNPALCLFYNAKSYYLANDLPKCIEQLQLMFYKGYRLPEAHYLLAQAAVKNANIPLAWETLSAVAGYSRRNKTFIILQHLVRTSSDFQRYLNILNDWIGDKKTLRLSPEIVLATTQAALRAKQYQVAKELWHNTFVHQQGRKTNEIIVFNSSANYFQLWHLPSLPFALKTFVDQNLLEGISQRLRQSVSKGLALLQQLGINAFLSGRTAWEAHQGLAFAANHPLEMGYIGELSQLSLLAAHPSVLDVDLNEAEAWLSFSLIDGSNFRLHRYAEQNHATQDNTILYHYYAGLCWQHQAFKVQCSAQTNHWPIPAESYFNDYYPLEVSANALWWTDSSNVQIINQDHTIIASYEQYYWLSRYAFAHHADLMLREISKLDGNAVYQQLAIKGTLVPTLEQIKQDAPKVVLYVTGLEKVAYQGNMWIPVLEKLPVRCAIVLREKQTAAELIPTSLPVYFMSTMRDLELLEEAGVKTILYPANTQKNVQTLRFHKMQHFFINHGDSDKVVNQSKFLMAYDKLLVAGPLAEQRIHNAGLPTRQGQIEHVGRPQVELMLEQVKQPCSKLKTLLYAPTWEGFVEEANYSSVCELGLTMLKQILQTGEYQVLFKPHPYTGYNKEGNCQYYLEQMQALASEYKQLTLVDINLGIHPLMNQSDLLITDISSVLNDYLYTLKPIILVNPKAYSAETLATEFPSSRAANVLNEGDNVTDLLALIRQQDPLYTKRQQVCVDALGDFPEGSLKRFEKIIIESTQKNANN